MSIIIRDATNPSNLAAVDPDGSVHVVGAVSINDGTASPVDTELGKAASYAVLAAAGITNSGSTVVNGGVIGSYPTVSITGFPPGIAVVDNMDASFAQSAALAAYNFYSALSFTSLSGSSADLSVLGNGSSASTYLPGNYSAGSTMDIPTSITLDAQGDPNAIFVFKAGSTLTLESGASVLLINGALANNVVWIVGSSATTVATSTMTGNILANTSITLGGGTLNGRALAGIVTSSGSVTISTATQINTPASLQSPILVEVVNLPSAVAVTNFPTGFIADGVVATAADTDLAAGTVNPLQVNGGGALFVDITGRTNTYRGCQSAFIPLADPSVPFFVIQGSATKVVKIRHLKLTWACTTGNAAPNVLRLRRYTAISGGTSNAVTAVPLDTLNAAATAVVSQYSALPTVATPFNAGSISSEYMQWITNAAGLVGPVSAQLDFGVDNCQALTLRGVSDFIGIEISAVAAGGPTMTIRCSWTEA